MEHKCIQTNTIKEIRDRQADMAISDTKREVAIAIIDEKLSNVEKKVDSVITKIDCFNALIENKAEKTDLKTLDDRFWFIVISMLFLLAGIIGAWFKK